MKYLLCIFLFVIKTRSINTPIIRGIFLKNSTHKVRNRKNNLNIFRNVKFTYCIIIHNSLKMLHFVIYRTTDCYLVHANSVLQLKRKKKTTNSVAV